MRLPLKELERYCVPGLPVEDLIDRLVMTGTEVEAVHQIGPPSTEGFVLGYVRSVEKHPNADRLNVCEVDTGDEKPRTIVCGAANVAAGQVVAVALPGAVMPGGMKIKRAKLRGVASEGMICSEAELGISPEGAGIMVIAEGEELQAPGVFPDTYRPGKPLEQKLRFSDTVLELEVTPNRSDCFGLYGLAREVGAITDTPLFDPPWTKDADATGSEPVEKLASVTVEVPELCPRFTARVFTDVKVGPSPLWLKQALMAMGQRPINNVVDITNWVMLVTGQPLHAFDLDLVPDGSLTIRTATAGEKVETLDGVERELDEEMVVVCDKNGPAAIAGIMGGAKSEVSAETTRVLLEVANWDGPNILGSSRRLSLRSEASSRFERQLHPALCDRAQAMASSLLVDLCGAEMAPGTIDVSVGMPQEREITLVRGDVEKLLGVEVPVEQMDRSLDRLGFKVLTVMYELKPGAKEPREYPETVVVVPPERHYDVTRQADLIEEIGRLHGYENLPSTLPAIARPGGLSREQRLRRVAEDILRHQGFNEIVGWSFTDRAEFERLQIEEERPLLLANPLSEEQSVMRTTLLGSLLDAAAFNSSRGADRVALFESGRVYLPAGSADDGSPSPAAEPHRIAALLLGPLRPAGWDGTSEVGGFFALKGVLEALADNLGLTLSLETTSQYRFLHPGRAARISLSEPVGWIGEIHPGVLDEWGLSVRNVVGFEFDLAPLISASNSEDEIYSDVTSFPAVHQDLAIVIPEDVTAATAEAAVAEAGGPLLAGMRIFDLYRGEQVGEGRKSLALSLEFRASDRTLTEAEVAGLRSSIESAIAEIGGSVRE